VALRKLDGPPTGWIGSGEPPDLPRIGPVGSRQQSLQAVCFIVCGERVLRTLGKEGIFRESIISQ
jgi:hypothetical protein